MGGIDKNAPHIWKLTWIVFSKQYLESHSPYVWTSSEKLHGFESQQNYSKFTITGTLGISALRIDNSLSVPAFCFLLFCGSR